MVDDNYQLSDRQRRRLISQTKRDLRRAGPSFQLEMAAGLIGYHPEPAVIIDMPRPLKDISQAVA